MQCVLFPDKQLNLINHYLQMRGWGVIVQQSDWTLSQKDSSLVHIVKKITKTLIKTTVSLSATAVLFYFLAFYFLFLGQADMPFAVNNDVLKNAF